MLNEEQELDKKLLLEVIPEMKGVVKDEYLAQILMSSDELAEVELPGDKKLELKQIHDFVKTTLSLIRDLRTKFPELLTQQQSTTFEVKLGKDSIVIKTKNPKIEAEIIKRLPLILKKMGQNARNR